MSPAEIVAGADAVVLDFDGPMCDLFARVDVYEVARDVGALAIKLSSDSERSVLYDLRSSGDPLAVVRGVADSSPQEAVEVGRRLQMWEVAAAQSAPTTEGLLEFLQDCSDRNQAVGIASNNSIEAVCRWLEVNDLTSAIAYVEGRNREATRMKPDPHQLLQVSSALGVDPSRCVFVGDSLSDGIAARASSMSFIAFANKPEKTGLFLEQGCRTIIDSMTVLLSDQ